MKRYNSLLEAAEYAVTCCNNWNFAFTDEKYDTQSLLTMAEVSDSENPVDEDCFYVVSNNGAIGLYEDGEDIDWIFLPAHGKYEDLPVIFEATFQNKFCSECGTELTIGDRFCGACGAQIDL